MIGKILKELRKENKINQTELGKILNVTHQAISLWENDKSDPDLETLVKIAEFFNVQLTTYSALPSTKSLSKSVR